MIITKRLIKESCKFSTYMTIKTITSEQQETMKKRVSTLTQNY